MDRKSWICLILSIIGLATWEWYYLKHFAPGEEYSEEPSRVSPAPPSLLISSSSQRFSAVPFKTATLRSSVADYWFSDYLGGISKIVIVNHLDGAHRPIAINGASEFPIGVFWLAPETPIGGFAMTVNKITQSITFTKTAENGMRISKRFFLLTDKDRDNQYQIQLECTFQNPTSTDIHWPSYWISAGSTTPTHSAELPNYSQFNWLNSNKLTTIDVSWFDGSRIPLLEIVTRTPATFYQKSIASVKWASVSSQYFCTFLIISDSSGSGVLARRIPLQIDSRLHGIDGRIEMPGFRLASGQTRVQSFTIYSGPKELSRLQSMGDGQDAILAYGPFRMVSEWLLWAMKWFYSIFGNYAWAIIALTLLIKLCLWPLQNKATRAMRQLSLLAPKVTELREKYKGEPQKMNEEMMKLYRAYGVNPLGGCLPMLIQIPIFFGFYSMLGTSIELRNSSFLWIRDLSQPDTVLHLLGFPVNLLPILVAGTMIWQMAISPKSGDVLQQRIFYVMPIIFLAFCYNYASGLALYWTTQNIFSILQLYLTENQPLLQLERSLVKKHGKRTHSSSS